MEDVTFKNARLQSSILKEGVADTENKKQEVEVPKSLTPEQVKTYILKLIKSSQNEDEKRVFAQVIHWIDALTETKKKLTALELEKMKHINIRDDEMTVTSSLKADNESEIDALADAVASSVQK